ncbi:hypothetical protein [Nonomuraea cavernae]|uniref:Uncharacterized protein n=1 Tax=Nonomuraea cavernae TaxID=2045107 RepID=A0A917ZGA9_9ACTN|nr:hypothetical protein [Nonomuraea cavernae]MCA2190848.1 hypothetical protein [Nonomuraea cavernae]GGO82835.1 hypothetical protein GCM10012289_74980 [Nonomuraea cavernae]
METDTVMDARAWLELLRGELAERGWDAEIRSIRARPHLWIVNPDDRKLNGMVAAQGDHYRWTWGPVLGRAGNVHGVSDKILHVLRGVS